MLAFPKSFLNILQLVTARVVEDVQGDIVLRDVMNSDVGVLATQSDITGLQDDCSHWGRISVDDSGTSARIGLDEIIDVQTGPDVTTATCDHDFDVWGTDEQELLYDVSSLGEHVSRNVSHYRD